MSRAHPARVLVIDDERYMRGLLCELLTIWGCEADAASSGREGLIRFAQGRYDLVLTDLVMPGLTGLEVVERVRRADAEVGLIMFTASSTDLQPHGRRLGFTVLRKPLEIGSLETAVKHALADPTAAT
jgi:DNA-binding response OmpR family regulator